MTGRVWSDGWSDLHIEHTPGKRVRFRIDNDGEPGHAVEVDKPTAAEITDYIQGGGA
jgi:hypothetical protein